MNGEWSGSVATVAGGVADVGAVGEGWAVVDGAGVVAVVVAGDGCC